MISKKPKSIRLYSPWEDIIITECTIAKAKLIMIKKYNWDTINPQSVKPIKRHDSSSFLLYKIYKKYL